MRREPTRASVAAAASSVARSPSTSGVRATPNAVGGVGRVGAARLRQVRRRHRVDRDPEEAGERRGGGLPVRVGRRGVVVAQQRRRNRRPVSDVGPLEPPRPAEPARVVVDRRDAPRRDRRRTRGATSWSPGPATNGGADKRPLDRGREPQPSEPVHVRRTARSRAPARSPRPPPPRAPSPAGTGARPRGRRPGTESSTTRRCPPRFAASIAARTDAVVRPEQLVGGRAGSGRRPDAPACGTEAGPRRARRRGRARGRATFAPSARSGVGRLGAPDGRPDLVEREQRPHDRVAHHARRSVSPGPSRPKATSQLTGETRCTCNSLLSSPAVSAALDRLTRTSSTCCGAAACG